MVFDTQLGANASDERAEAAVRRSQAQNPVLDIAFKRGGHEMEGSDATLQFRSTATSDADGVPPLSPSH